MSPLLYISYWAATAFTIITTFWGLERFTQPTGFLGDLFCGVVTLQAAATALTSRELLHPGSRKRWNGKEPILYFLRGLWGLCFVVGAFAAVVADLNLCSLFTRSEDESETSVVKIIVGFFVVAFAIAFATIPIVISMLPKVRFSPEKLPPEMIDPDGPPSRG